METLWQDLRFSFRALRRNLGFTLVAVFTLVLGVAATASVTTVVSGVLLRGLPYQDSDRLVFFQQLKEEDGGQERFLSSYFDARDWQARCASFEAVGAYTDGTAFNMSTEGEPERVSGEIVDSGYFRALRVAPVLGRVFAGQDDRAPGAPRIVVLGHALWQRRFGGARTVVGTSLLLDGQSYQVVGVMPAGFHGLTDEAELWLPVTMGNEILGDPRYLTRRAVRWLNVVGRLKVGIGLARAASEVDALDANLAKEFPDSNEHMVVHLTSLERKLFGDLRFPLLTLLGASTFVLLIAWATVANLLLARATARQKEIAVRDALGATRRRLLRQLLTESLVLAGLSCAAGLILAQLVTGALIAASAVKLQSFVATGLDLPVVAAIGTLSLLCGAGFGLAPAWLGARGSAVTLRQGASSSNRQRHRFQSSLVVAEVALALFLLVGAGLLIKGFRRFVQTPLGFKPANLLTVRVDLKGKRYADAKLMILLARQYHSRLAAIPGVTAVAIESPTLPNGEWAGISFIVEDLLAKTKDGVAYLVFHHVSPGFFRNLGIPLVQGRDFTDADTDTSPRVIVISQAMARKYWPAESPLGKRMKFGKRDPSAPWFTVIGVVGDLNHHAMQELDWPGPDVYFSLFQFPPLLTPQLNFMLRTAGVPPLSLVPRAESELRAAAPSLPPYDPDTMEHRLSVFAAKSRFLVLLMGLFAGVALVLATVGIYGVLFYSVTQRTREMGIRAALGAQPRALLGLVMGRAAALAAVGLAIGLAASVVSNRLFANLLYGVSPTDLATFSGTSLALFLAAMAASYFPARRAMRVQLTISLRTE